MKKFKFDYSILKFNTEKNWEYTSYKYSNILFFQNFRKLKWTIICATEWASRYIEVFEEEGWK
jgi:hypothetical protein